jgi:hypothetical protein
LSSLLFSSLLFSWNQFPSGLQNPDKEIIFTNWISRSSDLKSCKLATDQRKSNLTRFAEEWENLKIKIVRCKSQLSETEGKETIQFEIVRCPTYALASRDRD